MRNLIITLTLLAILGACASQPVAPAPVLPAKPVAEKPAEKPVPPQPIVVAATPKPATLAKIDPTTLKVTYEKGADPKAFADEMVKSWAHAIGQLQQCQAQAQSLFSQLQEAQKK